MRRLVSRLTFRCYRQCVWCGRWFWSPAWWQVWNWWKRWWPVCPEHCSEKCSHAEVDFVCGHGGR